MTKYTYTALLIPNAGQSVTLRQAYASAVTALASGRTKAKLIFRTRADVQAVELVVLEHRHAPIFVELIHRDAPVARLEVLNEIR